MSGRIDSLGAIDYEAVLKLIRSADSILAGLLGEVTVEAEDGDTELWGHTVSDMQENIEVEGDAIYGSLMYVATGALPDVWGPGYFLTLKFSDADASATDVKVAMAPSVSSGLVSLDEDMNAVFKVTNKYEQRVEVLSTDGTRSTIQYFDVSNLNMKAQA